MSDDALSQVFGALADPTRRAILARLAQGEASVTELAAPFAMSMPAISKHLKVLERAGLITRGRDAQWRPCRLEAAAFKARHRLARALPPVLGRQPRPARHAAEDHPERKPKMTAPQREFTLVRDFDESGVAKGWAELLDSLELFVARRVTR